VTARVGIDLVEIAAIERSIADHAARYLDRVYTASELAECRDAVGDPDAGRLAGRFAVKEAVLKVLRSADEPIPWTHISVRADRFGAPTVELSGRARAAAQRKGVRQIDVSISHDGGLAAAVILADMEGES
jgi:holo-[acyl-carrier protein] synthase